MEAKTAFTTTLLAPRDRPDVRLRKERAWLARDRTGTEIGIDVQRERGVGPWIFIQQPVFDHEFRAVMAFFARLKHEFHGARQLVAMAMEKMHGLDEHGGVGIVAAGVH